MCYYDFYDAWITFGVFQQARKHTFLRACASWWKWRYGYHRGHRHDPPWTTLKKKRSAILVWTDHLRWIPKAVKWKLAGIYFVQRWVILNCDTCVRQRLIIIKDLPSLQTEHDVGRFGLWRPFWWAALNCGAKLRSLRATNLANLFVNSSWKCVCEGPFVAQRFSSCHRDGFVVCACLSKSSHE